MKFSNAAGSARILPPSIGRFFLGSFQIVACCLALGSLVAGAATTNPRGIYTVKIEGKPAGATHARTFLGIQLLPPIRYVGLAGGINGNTLTFSGADSPASLADPERKSYLHVLSGPGLGYVVDIEEFRQNDIVCATDLTPWLTAGTQFLIRFHSDLADLFGADNRFGLGSGPDADHADNLVIWDPISQQEKVYYFHNTRARWEPKGVEADASHAILRFPYGLYIVRRTTGTLRLALSGDAGFESVLLPVRPGANVFSLPINLSASLDNLISSDGGFSVLKGPNAKQADLLIFHEPSSGEERGPFYFQSRPNANGWREVGVNDSTAPIQALDLLSTLVLHRDAPAGHVLATGSLEPGPGTPIPADPEPGEIQLYGKLPAPVFPWPDLSYSVEISTDLQTWTSYATPVQEGNQLVFPLPPGQSRAFYRLNVTFAF